jgi:hypothetical protein
MKLNMNYINGTTHEELDLPTSPFLLADHIFIFWFHNEYGYISFFCLHILICPSVISKLFVFITSIICLKFP